MDKPKVTIIDVARRAGVSKGTVDRVVYNRGEVSKKSELKVRKAIEELGYEPNLHASLLASRQDRMIACLLPSFEAGEYWEKVHFGFEQGGREASQLGIRTRSFFYDQYDPASFDLAAEELLAAQPAGVVLPPMFAERSAAFVARLAALEIPYVYVDTKLEDENYLAYFGMHLYDSGILCARLLTERHEPSEVDRVAIVRINRDKGGLADPTAHRREAFLDFMRENYPTTEILNVFITPSNPESIEPDLEEFFGKYPDIHYVVMFNSRVRLLSGYLTKHPDPKRRVIGFDDLEGNLQLLREGKVEIIISQHAEKQSHRAVRALGEYIVMHKSPQLRDNYMHMDILTQYNEKNY